MLNKLTLFFGDDPDVLQSVKAACIPMVFKSGASILSQDDKSKSVYYILGGTAKAILYSEEGDEIWLKEFSTGDLFGEMALLGAQTRTADIVATSTVQAAIFSEESFMSLMNKHGSIGIRVSRLLVDRVHQTTQRMFELSAFSAKGRVCAEILRMSSMNENNELSIENLPSFAAFAQRISSTRETVSRTVSELGRMGYVEKKGRQLIICRPEEIKNLQNW